MKNLHKLLIVFISVLFLTTGAFAQSSNVLAPIDKVMEQKVKPEKPQKYNPQLERERLMELAAIKPSLGKAPANLVTITSPSIGGGLAKGTQAYAFDLNAASVVYFDTDNPGSFTTIGSPVVNPYAGDFDNVNTSFFYVIDADSDNLYTIDIATGVETLVAPVTGGTAGFTWTGMACDKATGEMYVTSTDGASSNLFTLDLVTGALTLVGATGIPAVIEIAIDGAGTMYGWDIINDECFTIDMSTGASTLLGPLGVDLNYAQGGNYDPESDVIYVAAYTTVGQLMTLDKATGALVLVGGFPAGDEVDALAFPGSLVSFDVDLSIQSIISPSSGVDLTATEPVTVRVRNNGTTDQSNFDVSFSLDGGTTITENISSTLVAGETLDHTFATTVDLSAYGTYVVYACVTLTGDENPDNDCKTKTVVNSEPSLCFPTYSSGCSADDGFTDFAVEEIQNFGSGCEDNTGFTGCSQYLEMGPALLIPGNTHTFTMGSGYANQHVNIWIDFNDNLLLEADEMILTDYLIVAVGVLYDVDITIPADATGGLHIMRAMTVWPSAFSDPCGSYSFGESEDYMVLIGGQEFGHITGNVMLDGIAPYNMGDVTEVVVAGGSFMTYPDASGNFDLEIYPGTYDITATLYGYTQQVEAGLVIAEGATVSGVDFTLPGITGRVMGTITDVDTGDPINGAEVTLVGTGMMVVTGADGTYELFAEAGTYNVKANHVNYGVQTEMDIEIMAETDTQLDFQLGFAESCQFSIVLWDDFGDGWNGNTLTIMVDGEVVLENIGIAAGFGPETHYFEVESGSEVTCVYVGTVAQWDYENSYFVYNNDDEEVFSDGLNGVAPVGGTFEATCIVFIYGDLAGTVTQAGTGDPIEGAEIMIDDLTGTTGSDGTYLIENVMIGTWDVYCDAVGYNPEMATGVVILEEMLTTQDFALTAPGVVVDPLVITETLDIGQTTDVLVNISNPGLGSLDWSAQIVIPVKGKEGISKDVIGSTEAINSDVIAVGTPMAFEKIKHTNIPMQTTKSGEKDDVDIIGGLGTAYNAGPRTRGNMFTCTEEKVLVEFMGWHSVTTNPTQMWMLVYECETQVGTYNLVVASDISPAPIGTGWVSSGEVNYLLTPGKYYMIVSSFQQACGYFAQQGVTPFPYPVAFGEATGGAGYSWAPTSVFPPDQTQAVPADVFVEPVLYYQQLVTTDAQNWISIDPESGSLGSMANEDMTVHLDATEIILPGIYAAEIHFTTMPDVGSPVVNVTLTVAGLIPAVNLTGDFDCTDVMLSWEMPTGGNPDSWNVYRDGTLLGSASAMEHTDEMVMTGIEYTYSVKAVYSGEESMATSPFMITVPIPGDLVPLNLEAMPNEPTGGDVTLTWDSPDACVAPDGYDVFRDGVQINTALVTEMTYIDSGIAAGLYEYKVKAVYYFGESGFSAAVYALIVGMEEVDAARFQIFPNPASDLVTVKSPVEISTIRVLNNSGQLVMDLKVNAAEHQLDVSQLESGIYYIRLDTSEGQILQKIVVE